VGEFKARKPRVDLSRPVVDLGSNGAREWRTVKMKELQIGDVVAGMGRVEMALEACDYTIYIEAGESTEDFFDPDIEVFAFVPKGN
jgi:hypothetical protein